MVGEGPESTAERAFYRGERTSSNQILGVGTDYATISFMKLQLGRFFTEPEVRIRRRVVVLGDGLLSGAVRLEGIDPINKKFDWARSNIRSSASWTRGHPSAASIRDRTISPSFPTRRTRLCSTSTSRDHCARRRLRRHHRNPAAR